VVEETAPPSRPTKPAIQPTPDVALRPAAPPATADPKTLAIVLAAFTGLAYALSARALLLLTLVGAFVLAVMAERNQTQASLFVLIAYALLTVIPVCILEVRKRA
jgi:hypothetical protein